MILYQFWVEVVAKKRGIVNGKFAEKIRCTDRYVDPSAYASLSDSGRL